MLIPTSLGRRSVHRISVFALGFYGILGPRMFPSVALDAPLRIVVLFLAVLGAWTLATGDQEKDGPRGDTAGDRVRVTQVFIGGLLGASFVAPWASFPWLVLPALAIAWAWRGPSGRRHIPGTGPATACLSALTICTLLAGVSSRGLRVSHEEFSTKDFPVNCLLVEIPLHDAWAIDLRGHPSPTLDNLGAAFRHLSPFQATPAGTGLSMLRRMVGFAFGWEDPEWSKEEESLVHDLTEATDLHSTTEPGTLIGIWRVLYTLPREGVVETVNGTAHVAVAASIGAGPESSRLFLSFRVREVNWTTRFYMGLIDPFRRFFVYPPLLRQFAHTWERGDWDSPQETSAGEKR